MWDYRWPNAFASGTESFEVATYPGNPNKIRVSNGYRNNFHVTNQFLPQTLCYFKPAIAPGSFAKVTILLLFSEFADTEQFY